MIRDDTNRYYNIISKNSLDIVYRKSSDLSMKELINEIDNTISIVDKRVDLRVLENKYASEKEIISISNDTLK